MSGLYQNARIEAKLDQLLAGGGASGSVTALPPGYIAPFLADAIPDGWVALNGQTITIADNPMLYALFADRYNDIVDVAATRLAATSLIPAMTAENVPAGYTASASSSSGAGYEAWRAFDGLTGTANAWRTSDGVFTGWLHIDLPAAKAITSYSITTEIFLGTCDFTLDGSNDGGATWVVLDARTGEQNWQPGSTHSFELDASQLVNTYTSLRLNITKFATGNNYIGIDELKINGVDQVVLAPLPSGQFRVPNLKSSPADLPGSVWCVKVG